MKILLTGKNGQVGHELARSLAEYEVVAIDKDECDLADARALRGLIRAVQPDVIVNPAAYTAVDAAEDDKENAFAINAGAPGVLGEEAARLGAMVVHFSTDYVFDGKKASAYVETDPTGPLGVYGASKLAGEQALATSGAKHVILRTSWVIGAHGNNFAKTILRLAKEREQLRVVADQHGVPTSARLLAQVTATLLRDREKLAAATGVYHVVPNGETTWHGVAAFVIEEARRAGVALAVKEIAAIPTSAYPTRALRPGNSCLATQKFTQTFSFALPAWAASLQETLNQLLRS